MDVGRSACRCTCACVCDWALCIAARANPAPSLSSQLSLLRHTHTGSVALHRYFNGRVEGELRLRSPAAMLSYVNLARTTAPLSGFGGTGAGGGGVGGASGGGNAFGSGSSIPMSPTAMALTGAVVPVDTSAGVRLYLSASIRPVLPKPNPAPEGGASRTARRRAEGVDPAVMDHAAAWEVKYKGKDRHVKVSRGRQTTLTWEGVGRRRCLLAACDTCTHSSLTYHLVGPLSPLFSYHASTLI